MVVGELHGFMPVSSKMKSSTHGIFLSSPFVGRKLGNGHAYTISSVQLSKFNFPRKTLSTSRRFSTTTAVLADYTKDSMTFQASMFEKQAADPKTVAAIILGGGAGTRLFPLTRRRAKPAVPIGGCYRLIDVPMSNCINSGINKIYILTQFNSQSLNRHIARTYNQGNGVNFGDGFVEVLAATQTPGESGKKWFQGTADAVRQFIWLFEDVKLRHIENILVLSGDHLYRMDYMDVLQKHIESGADISVSCLPVNDSRASDFGLVKIDESGKIRQFLEKPKGENLKSMKVDTTVLGLSVQDAIKFPYIASMGIYMFKTDVLLKLQSLQYLFVMVVTRNIVYRVKNWQWGEASVFVNLKFDERNYLYTIDIKNKWWNYPTANDFGSEIIPMSAKEYNVQAYLFNGYWEDIGTIKSFFDANLALTDQPPNFHFFDPLKPIFTSPRFLPPTKIEKCRVKDSIVSHGCFLRECSVEHSIIGIRSRLEYGVELKDTMMIGADYYQTEAEIAAALAEGRVPVGVGKDTKIVNCIIDKNARIGKNVIIANKEKVQEAERPSEGFYIRSGISVVLKNSVIKDGTII